MISRLLAVLFFLALNVNPLFSQILINEVSSAGYEQFADEDGDHKDWIEFYNAGSVAVNMQGYTIQCIEGLEQRSWTFPEIYFQPGDHLTVFFSGKNRRDYFDHWEVPVYPQLPFRHMPGISQPPSNWNQVGFNDTPWLLAPGPIGERP